MSGIDFKTGSGSKVGIGGSKLALNRDKTTATDQAMAKESPISAVARSASLNLQDTATQTTYNPTLPTEVPLDQIWREDVQVRLVHVDNAIEKLLNKEHTLVKPLRFGKDTKFEEEGKKYSINRINI